MNARKATVPLLMAAILGTALALSILEVQHVSAAGNDNDNDNAIKSDHALKGQIASVQTGTGGQPEWIQSGIWVLRMFSSDPQHPSAQLVARFEMVKPDGTAAHSHSIYNFKATEMAQEGNSTSVLKGTATVTMKDGPVADVPLTVKVFNNAVIGIWIGPDKVSSHFGTGPVYGTLSVSSKATATTTMMTSGMGRSSVAPGQNNNNTGTSNTPAIKMNAQEVNGTYRWSTSDGINPMLKMTANADNAVQIANPTDTKHELVIEANGKELATSGDIAPDGSGHLAFKPTAAGTYAYHCEYHPDTMKGTIEVASP
jgi:plastocyanin